MKLITLQITVEYPYVDDVAKILTEQNATLEEYGKAIYILSKQDNLPIVRVLMFEEDADQEFNKFVKTMLQYLESYLK